MENRGRGCRGRPRDNSQPIPVFDPHAFIEAIGTAVAVIVQASVVAATTTRTSATMGQGETSNLQGFQAHRFPTYMGGGDSMVRIALAIAREVDDTRRIQGKGASARSRKKHKTSSLYRFQGRGRSYQGQGRVGVSRQTGQMTCYHYHQPRHMRRDCPQRQGSRNYGTSQFQSSMGHARFVPSYPGMGQGNQCQSQGATQEPTILLMGHMGQGMGQGETTTSRPVLQGPRSVSTLWYRRLSLQISLIYKVRFLSHTS